MGNIFNGAGKYDLNVACSCWEHGWTSPKCLPVAKIWKQAMTIGHEALGPAQRVLEADDQRKRLQIGNATTAGGSVKKQQVQYLLMQKNNHITAKNPHHWTACKRFTACQPRNNTFPGNERLRRLLLTAGKIHCRHAFETLYRDFCLFTFLRLFWQESTIFLSNRVFIKSTWVGQRWLSTKQVQCNASRFFFETQSTQWYSAKN